MSSAHYYTVKQDVFKCKYCVFESLNQFEINEHLSANHEYYINIPSDMFAPWEDTSDVPSQMFEHWDGSNEIQSTGEQTFTM